MDVPPFHYFGNECSYTSNALNTNLSERLQAPRGMEANELMKVLVNIPPCFMSFRPG
jgi:hypothetical protein